MNDVNPRQKYRKQKWDTTAKFTSCYWKISKKNFQFTHVSARMNLILLFEDTTSISISGPLSKERHIATHANPEISRAVLQLQWSKKIESWTIFPLAISRCISLFLTIPGSFLETKVTGKRINRREGYGLETPYKYCPSKHFLFSKTSSRRLEDVFCVTLFVFQDVLKTSLRRLQDVFAIHLPKTSSRRFEDVFKTFSRRVCKTSCNYVFKTSSRRL